LVADLEKAKQIVYRDIKDMFHVSIPLNKKQEEMLIDFAFNLGTLKKFPKFVRAVLDNDSIGMKREFKRSSNHTELTGRNQAFEKRFLK
jgi:GH24 family phage-related lysozyme (muramidase)